MAERGQKAPAANAVYPKFRITGREFDPAKAAEYAKSFPISRSAA